MCCFKKYLLFITLFFGFVPLLQAMVFEELRLGSFSSTHRQIIEKGKEIGVEIDYAAFSENPTIPRQKQFLDLLHQQVLPGNQHKLILKNVFFNSEIFAHLYYVLKEAKKKSTTSVEHLELNRCTVETYGDLYKWEPLADEDVGLLDIKVVIGGPLERFMPPSPELRPKIKSGSRALADELGKLSSDRLAVLKSSANETVEINFRGAEMSHSMSPQAIQSMFMRFSNNLNKIEDGTKTVIIENTVFDSRMLSHLLYALDNVRPLEANPAFSTSVETLRLRYCTVKDIPTLTVLKVLGPQFSRLDLKSVNFETGELPPSQGVAGFQSDLTNGSQEMAEWFRDSVSAGVISITTAPTP